MNKFSGPQTIVIETVAGDCCVDVPAFSISSYLCTLIIMRMNKFLLVLTGLLLVLALTCFSTSPEWVFAHSYTEGYLSAAGIVVLVMMLVNGTFRGSLLFKLCVLAFGLLPVGMVFKFFHLPGADVLMVLPLLLVPAFYAIFFVMKRPITLLDVLKFLTVITFFLPSPLSALGLIPEGFQLLVGVLTHSVIWITFVDFVIIKLAEGTLWGR